MSWKSNIMMRNFNDVELCEVKSIVSLEDFFNGITICISRCLARALIIDVMSCCSSQWFWPFEQRFICVKFTIQNFDFRRNVREILFSSSFRILSKLINKSKNILTNILHVFRKIRVPRREDLRVVNISTYLKVMGQRTVFWSRKIELNRRRSVDKRPVVLFFNR